MSVPKAVREQREKSDRLLKSMNPHLEDDNNPPDQDPTPTADEQQQAVDNQDPPVQQTGLQKEVARLTQANNVLQGKYRAETGRLQARIDELEAIVESLKPLVDKAKQAQIDQTKQKLVDQFGEEAAEVMMDLVQSGRPQEEPQTRDPQDIRRLEFNQFKIELRQICSQWEELNVEEGFLNWLQHPSDDTGVVRQEALDQAVARRNAVAAGSIFNAYLRARDSKPGGREHSIDAPGSGGGRPDPDSQSGDDKYLSLAELKKLDQEYRTGAYRGREKKYREERRAFEIAAAEGRLR